MGTIPPTHSMEWNGVLDSPFFFVSFFPFSLWSVCIYLSVCIFLLLFFHGRCIKQALDWKLPQELGWNG